MTYQEDVNQIYKVQDFIRDAEKELINQIGQGLKNGAIAEDSNKRKNQILELVTIEYLSAFSNRLALEQNIKSQARLEGFMKYFAKYNERVKTLQERVEQTERTEESIENLEEIKESIQEASEKLEEEIEEACKELEKDVNKEEIVLPPPIERKETEKEKKVKAFKQVVENEQTKETNERSKSNYVYTSINNKSIERDEINKTRLNLYNKNRVRPMSKPQFSVYYASNETTFDWQNLLNQAESLYAIALSHDPLFHEFSIKKLDFLKHFLLKGSVDNNEPKLSDHIKQNDLTQNQKMTLLYELMYLEQATAQLEAEFLTNKMQNNDDAKKAYKTYLEEANEIDGQQQDPKGVADIHPDPKEGPSPEGDQGQIPLTDYYNKENKNTEDNDLSFNSLLELFFSPFYSKKVMSAEEEEQYDRDLGNRPSLTPFNDPNKQ